MTDPEGFGEDFDVGLDSLALGDEDNGWGSISDFGDDSLSFGMGDGHDVSSDQLSDSLTLNPIDEVYDIQPRRRKPEVISVIEKYAKSFLNLAAMYTALTGSPVGAAIVVSKSLLKIDVAAKLLANGKEISDSIVSALLPSEAAGLDDGFLEVPLNPEAQNTVSTVMFAAMDEGANSTARSAARILALDTNSPMEIRTTLAHFAVGQ